MSATVRNIIDIMEKFAPSAYKEDYDNVGLMVGRESAEVDSILVALDCTFQVIEEAIERGANLILTHHPLIFRKPSAITDATLQGRLIMELIKQDISLYSSHTNLDIVSGGINDLILEVLGYESSEIIERRNGNENIGIGRMVNLKDKITLLELCDKIKEGLKLKYVRYSGEDQGLIKRIAVVNGSGEDYFEKARVLKADCILTGDTTYHPVSDFLQQNIAVIDAGHFATEWPAMKLFAQVLNQMLSEKGYSCSVLLSNATKDPYKMR